MEQSGIIHKKEMNRTVFIFPVFNILHYENAILKRI